MARIAVVCPHCGGRATAIPDADILAAAAVVYRNRSKNPKGFWTMVVVRLLMDSARKLAANDKVPESNGQHG